MDQDNVECNLIEMLWDFIRLKQYEDALSEIRKEVHSVYLYENSLEIIPSLAAICNDPSYDENSEECLEGLLMQIAVMSNYKESTIGFLEQMEKVSSVSLFNILLKPLGHILKNTILSKNKTYSWILQIIYEKIENFDLPVDYLFHDYGENILQYDQDNLKTKIMIEKMITFYNDFYPFSDKTENNKVPNSIVTDLVHYILLLFEKPLLYLHLEINGNFYQIATKLVFMLIQLTHNVLFFIKSIRFFNDDFLERNKIKDDKYLSQLGISSYLYCVIFFNDVSNWMPQIYNPSYLCYSCLPSCIYLLKESKLTPKFKGIQLTEHFICLLPSNSLTLDSYEVPHLLNLSSCLIDIILCCENERLRKRGLFVLKLYCKKFEKLARLCLMQHILKCYQHSGLHSIVIYEFKEVLIDEYKNKCCNFNDKDFCNTLVFCCSLPSKETTDLLESSDKIIAALNLLIYLSIRDKLNSSGWKVCLPTIMEEFIKPLNTGLRLSKGHYNMKLGELKENILITGNNEVQISLDNQCMPNNKVSEELSIVQLALTCFDVISSLVVRLETLLEH